MSKEKSDIQVELLHIWGMSKLLQQRLDKLTKIRPVNTAAQRAAIESAQAGLRGWRGINLGELLNAYGLPPEERG